MARPVGPTVAPRTERPAVRTAGTPAGPRTGTRAGEPGTRRGRTVGMTVARPAGTPWDRAAGTQGRSPTDMSPASPVAQLGYPPGTGTPTGRSMACGAAASELPAATRSDVAPVGGSAAAAPEWPAACSAAVAAGRPTGGSTAVAPGLPVGIRRRERGRRRPDRPAPRAPPGGRPRVRPVRTSQPAGNSCGPRAGCPAPRPHRPARGRSPAARDDRHSTGADRRPAPPPAPGAPRRDRRLADATGPTGGRRRAGPGDQGRSWVGRP